MVTGQKRKNWAAIPANIVKLASRVRGLSVGGFGFSGGVSFAPPEDVARPIRGLLTFLDDKRVLHAVGLIDFLHDRRIDEVSRPQRIAESVLEIRRKIVAVLEMHEYDQDTRAILNEMQRACRMLLDQGTAEDGKMCVKDSVLGRFRLVFALAVEYLGKSYNLTPERNLAQLIAGAHQYLSQQPALRELNPDPTELSRMLNSKNDHGHSLLGCQREGREAPQKPDGS
jgi:hypothetical protein